jgi:hypothetical protein
MNFVGTWITSSQKGVFSASSLTIRDGVFLERSILRERATLSNGSRNIDLLNRNVEFKI